MAGRSIPPSGSTVKINKIGSHHDAVAPILLGTEELLVASPYQLVGCEILFTERDGHAAADGHLKCRVVVFERMFLDERANALRDLGGAFVGGFGEDDGKLLAAVAREEFFLAN